MAFKKYQSVERVEAVKKEEIDKANEKQLEKQGLLRRLARITD